MTAGIITILAALIPFGIWLYKRKAAKNDDPNVQLEKAKNETDKIIKNRDGRALSVHLNAVLRRLRNKSGGDSGRP